MSVCVARQTERTFGWGYLCSTLSFLLLLPLSLDERVMNQEKESPPPHQRQDEEEEEQTPLSMPAAASMNENEEPKHEEEKIRAAAAALVLDPEQPPLIEREAKKRDALQEDDPEEESAAPPPLVRTQARQLSRVGAMAIAGINASFVVEPPPAEPETDEENPPLTTLEATASNASTYYSVASTVAVPDVTATLVSDAEYEAELQRVILRTAVRASKVETEEEETETKKWSRGFILSIFCGSLVLIIIIATAVFTASPDWFEPEVDSEDSDDVIAPQALDDDAVSDNEKELDFFLKGRSFDGGEALNLYASPQRTALRYIAAEFPGHALDEKLIDIYAVATFFFSTGGTFWTNNTKWKSGDSVCIWHGIGCDEEDHVISISLANNYLRGNLPPELGLLAPRQVDGNKTTLGLTKLDLSYNYIKGSIPEEVASLTSMDEFKVNGNELSGNIPFGISSWAGLEYASFTENNLEGEIPVGLCQQTDAQQIAVDCSNVKCSCCTPSCFADQEEFIDATRAGATASPSPSDD